MLNCGETVQKITGQLFSQGSGSTYAYGVLDSYQKWDMAKEYAINMAKFAILRATQRDFGSGGYCTIQHIAKDGYENILWKKDVNDIHKEWIAQLGYEVNFDYTNSVQRDVDLLKRN